MLDAWLSVSELTQYEAWRRSTADQRARQHERAESEERARNITAMLARHPDCMDPEKNHHLPGLRKNQAERYRREHLAAAQEYSAQLRDQAARAAAEAQAVAQVRAAWRPEGAR